MAYSKNQFYLRRLHSLLGVIPIGGFLIFHLLVNHQATKGAEAFKEFDIAEYTNRTFGMFGGREERVSLEFENRLVGVVLDHFGQEIMIISKDENHSGTHVHVNVSSQFFGWLAGLGSGITIVSPENVRREYRDFLKRALENYV